MRLAFALYKYFPYGGLQRDFAAFVSELLGRGHDCRVYTNSWQGEQLPGIDLRLAPPSAGSNVRRNRRFLEWVRAGLAAEPADGLIGFNKMPGLDIYYAGDPCFLDKALQERGFIYRLGWRFRHFAAWERKVFDPAGSTEILLISASEARKFDRHYHTPAARMHLLPPGVAVDRRRPPDALARRAQSRRALGLGQDVLALLFVGSGFVTKGLDRAIRALAGLRAAHPDFKLHLLVAGQDRADRFALLARRQQVADAVSFLGGRDDIGDLLLAADVLVHPARSEAAGIALLEALVAGLPVVTNSVCGYAHHVEAAGAGLVLPEPFEQGALEDALARMLRSEFRAACRDRGLAYAEREDLYSLHRTGADLIERFVRRKQGNGND
ncbi:MAG: glycosyltransferase family 4 protein [Pseudomonadales bacterium]|nr:glycosyltransferase family 4 protein [Halioglobus sp.]MCP5128414.1 glycosyltransferase family 4 protein [Pseudomonadales bacterium]